MRFGLLVDGETTVATGARARADLLWDALEQVQLAETLGFHCVWSIERIGGGAPAAAPEMWLAALAQHTSRIRIGHAARLLPFAYTSPIRVAEMAAVLDILSAGRLDFAAAPPAFEASSDEPPAGGTEDGGEIGPGCDEALRVIQGMWTSEAFSWSSERFTMPPRNVLPKPVQQPHPPLWWCGASQAAAVHAGERGLGFVRMPPAEGEQPLAIAGEVKAYRDALARARPIGATANPVFACVARWPDAKRPDETLARVEALAQAGVDTLLLHVRPGARAPAETSEGLQRFGREVMPRFAG